MRKLVVSVGHGARLADNAVIKRRWEGSWADFVTSMLSQVKETPDKASNGWVCGAEFRGNRRHGDDFIARHFLSLDYDKITPEIFQETLDRVRESGLSFLCYTTASHTLEAPRLRVWIPLTRPCGDDEFRAVARRAGANFGGAERAAKESYAPAQYMFRPTYPPFGSFEHWERLDGSFLDVDATLATYADWTDYRQWPGYDGGSGSRSDALAKPGIIGAFNRAFPVSVAIDRFNLPYREARAGRWTYNLGSRPEGARVYDDDTKLHSDHDTDPAHGQHNAYDLVRIHNYGNLDEWAPAGAPFSELPSVVEMAKFAADLKEVRDALVSSEFSTPITEEDIAGLEPVEKSTVGEVVKLPPLLPKPASPNTDQSNARLVQWRNRKRLISIGQTFYKFDGRSWVPDPEEGKRVTWELGNIYRRRLAKMKMALARTCAKEKREPTEDEIAVIEATVRWAKASGNGSHLTACHNILQSAMDFPADSLNRHPDLLACRNGTINLRTGELLKSRSQDLMIGASPYAYDPAAEAPRFKKFLWDIYEGYDDRQEMIDFMQRWFGYCATGFVSEHKILFHTGEGGNGKGTLIEIVHAVLGPVLGISANQSLIASEPSQGAASPEVARLLGARLATISETDSGLEVAGAAVKKLTGGDRLVARNLYKGLVEFMPTHKLQVFTNNKPVVRDQEYAMWRRILQVAYKQRWGDKAAIARGEAWYPKEDDLGAHIVAAEAQGVLAWLVEGAQRWFERKLDAPPEVTAATEAYRHEQDNMRRFLEARTVQDADASISLIGGYGSLFDAYKGWMDGMGYRPFGWIRFKNDLERALPRAAKLNETTVGGLKLLE